MMGGVDICKVSAVTSLTTWKIAGDLLGDLRFSVLLRSRFFSLTNAFLKSNLLGWLIGRFSLETVGVEYASLSAAAEHTVAFPLLNIERKLSRMLLSHIRSAWFNPPRRRRFLARSLLEWQELYDTTSALGENGNPTVSESYLIDLSPIEKLSIIREVLLSGFQLELYVDDEKSFVYWELSHVAHEHLATLNSLEPVIPKDSRAYGELIFVRSYLNAFRSLCHAQECSW
ncbi:hypothetical protein F5888DRAFT_364175 [Russula emetica]|nr:hypothetical protein F5888DRAFT_364175 [Russula emetica]